MPDEIEVQSDSAGCECGNDRGRLRDGGRICTECYIVELKAKNERLREALGTALDELVNAGYDYTDSEMNKLYSALSPPPPEESHYVTVAKIATALPTLSLEKEDEICRTFYDKIIPPEDEEEAGPGLEE